MRPFVCRRCCRNLSILWQTRSSALHFNGSATNPQSFKIGVENIHSASNAKWALLQRPSTHKRSTIRKLSVSTPASQASRPGNDPKPTLPVKHIAQNPGLYEQNCRDRNYIREAAYPWRIAELRKQRTGLQHEVLGIRESLKKAQKDIENITLKAGNGEQKAALLEKAKVLRTEVEVFEKRDGALEAEAQDLALALPNLSSSESPIGTTPTVLEYLPVLAPDGTEKTLLHAKSHVDIGNELSLLSFPPATRTSGHGFYALLNEGAFLEQALIQHALSQVATPTQGFTAMAPPSLVYSHIASATGFKPRDQNHEQQIYDIQQTGSDAERGKPGLSLAGTAEIPLAGMYTRQTLDERQVPSKYVAVGRCYRAEAGARGQLGKGLYRVHEFSKVEMFAWTEPENSGAGIADQDAFFNTAVDAGGGQSQAERAFEQMLALQKAILKPLGLPLRVLEMPTGDLGATASRKIDIETWFPSRAIRSQPHTSEAASSTDPSGTHLSSFPEPGWGELTSLSLCTDYQSRRTNTLYKPKGSGGKSVFPWTINGTALAVPRILAAILETHWDPEREALRVPECLRRWMPEWCGEWIEKENVTTNLAKEP